MQHHVLIVDDSKLARMVMASAFRRLRPDWNLTEAVNADEALRVIANGAVDIALVDFNMPGTDGLELVSRIRAVNPEHAGRRRVGQRAGRDNLACTGTQCRVRR